MKAGSPKVRVLIADDDKALAAALSDTVQGSSDLELVAVAHDADQATALATEHRPDVVLMDVRMPGGGIAATRTVVSNLPGTNVVGLSAHEEVETARQMIEAGASGYIVKGMPEVEILDAIRRAARGQMSMPADLGVESIRDAMTQLRNHVATEAALKANVERIQGLLDGMPDAVLIVDHRGEIDLVNTTTQRMFGYSPGELNGKQVEVLVPERFRSSHRNLHMGFLHHPRSRNMGAGLQLYGRRKDGSEFPVDISLSPMTTPLGTNVVVAIREITDLQEAEELRRKSERLFRGVLESAPDAMIAVDVRGRIVVANTRVEQLFAYSHPELMAMSVDDLVPESLRSRHIAHRSRYLREPGIRPMGRGLELFGRRKDGTEFPVDISLSPMQTDDGLLVVAAVRDITERKLDERRQAETHESAERRRLVGHLVRAQEEERRRIASDIHDDSIQAMTAVSLRVQQLQKHLTDTKQVELLTRLDEAVRESIVRLRRMMFDLRPSALDRSGLAAAMRELLERVKADSGLEFAVEDHLGIEPSAELRVELYRVAQEALINVRKHAAAHSVRVEMERLERGYHVKIVDDGAGFEPQEHSEPGHVGLDAMRERAQIAGGWCRIESCKGCGTTVDFWLPDDRDLGAVTSLPDETGSPRVSPAGPRRASLSGSNQGRHRS